MHPESRAWVEAAVTLFGPFERVVDLGGADVNETYADLFVDATYDVVDKQPFENVTYVADIVDWLDQFGASHTWIPPYDLVVCTNVVEHEIRWRQIIRFVRYCLKRGGLFVCTAPGPAFPVHSHTGAALPDGEWYEARTSYDLAQQARDGGGLEVIAQLNDPSGMDAGIVARRR